MLSPVLDMSRGNADKIKDTDSEDTQPLSWKLSKKGSSSSIKAPPKFMKPPETRSSSRNLMKEALIDNKNKNKKRRTLKKSGCSCISNEKGRDS